MDTLKNRAVAVATQLGTCVAVLVLANAVLTPLVSPWRGGTATAKLLSASVRQQVRDHYGEVNDVALVNISVAADLSSLWNWNTHKIFFYVYAEYAATGTKQPSKLNRVVVWDRVIESKADSVFSADNVRAEYVLADTTGSLLHAPLTLVPEWSITPVTGLIAKQRGTPSEPVVISDFMKSSKQ